MSKSEKARVRIGAVLEAGETIAALATAQAKVESQVQRAAKDVAVSTAASMVFGALGGPAALRMSMPPQVWVVVTDRRLMLFQDGRNDHQALVGDLVFDARRPTVAVALNAGLLNEVVIADARTSAVAVRLNF